MLSCRVQLPSRSRAHPWPRVASSRRKGRRMSGTNVAKLRDWFEKKVVENHRLFYTIAWQILGDQHEAEDAVQNGACKAWSGLGELNDPATVVGWVARITRNVAIDMRRKRRERVAKDDELAMLDRGTVD